jgi:hypothetical protein
VDAKTAGDVRDRASGLEDEPDGALAQLIGVLPRGCHDWSISFPGQSLAWEPPEKPGCFTSSALSHPRAKRRPVTTMEGAGQAEGP